VLVHPHVLYVVTLFGPDSYLLGMRRYGDISIQYRYDGSRYVTWPSAIYRDTTLTFVIRGSHHVVSIFLYLTSFSYSFKKYNLWPLFV